MSSDSNPVIGGYSDLAEAYDSLGNLRSCWGQSTEKLLASISIPASSKRVADIGCGTGHALLALAQRSSPEISFTGVEPAAQMRERAADRVRQLPNVRVL